MRKGSSVKDLLSGHSLTNGHVADLLSRAVQELSLEDMAGSEEDAGARLPSEGTQRSQPALPEMSAANSVSVTGGAQASDTLRRGVAALHGSPSLGRASPRREGRLGSGVEASPMTPTASNLAARFFGGDGGGGGNGGESLAQMEEARGEAAAVARLRRRLQGVTDDADDIFDGAWVDGVREAALQMLARRFAESVPDQVICRCQGRGRFCHCGVSAHPGRARHLERDMHVVIAHRPYVAFMWQCECRVLCVACNRRHINRRHSNVRLEQCHLN